MQGFYKADGKPAFKSALRVTGYPHSTHSVRTRTDPVLVVHFILKGLPSEGHPVHHAVSTMRAFYRDNMQDLVFEEVIFDLDSNKAIDAHALILDGLVEILDRYSR